MFALPLTEEQYEVLFRFEKAAPNTGVKAYFTTPPAELDKSVIRNSTRTCSRQENACRRIYNALEQLSQLREESQLSDHVRLDKGSEYMSLTFLQIIEPLMPRYLSSPYHEPSKTLLSTMGNATDIALRFNVDRANLLRKRREVVALSNKVMLALDDFDAAFKEQG